MLGRFIMSLPDIKELNLPKKVFTAIDLRAWVIQNGGSMTGSFIDNVYFQSDEKLLFLKLRGPSGVLNYLLLQPSVRAHFTSIKLDLTDERPEDLSKIRRLIRDKKIAEVKQIGFDRVLEIGLHDGYKIIVELLPRGETVITDERGIIRYATEYREMRDRSILYGHPYRFPPLILELPTKDECENDADNVLRKLPREVVIEAKKREKTLCENLEDIYDESFRKGKGYIAYMEDSMVFFSPYRPTFLEEIGSKIIEFASFNDAVDLYYSKITAERLSFIQTQKLREGVERLKKTIERERARAEEFLRKSESTKKIADMLKSHRDKAENLLECVKNAIRAVGWDKVASRCPDIVATEPQSGRVIVNIEGVEIPINVRESVKDIIHSYYEEYKTFKQKYHRAMEILKGLEEKVEKQTIELEERRRESVMRARKVYWYERYVWSFTRNALLIIAGRDAQQNESIVRKYLKNQDWFLHADIQGAPATLLLAKDSSLPSEDDFYDAGVIAACFSKAWKEGLASVDVFYVRGDQVSKTPPPGEYLPRGSFMIYGKKSYLRNVPLKLAFGIEFTEERFSRFTVGSRESVEKRGELIGYLMPGENHPSKVAERIRKRIRELGIQYVPSPREIELLVPGPSKIKFIV